MFFDSSDILSRHQAIQKGTFSFFGDAQPPSVDAQNLIRALLKVDPRRLEMSLEVWQRFWCNMT